MHILASLEDGVVAPMPCRVLVQNHLGDGLVVTEPRAHHVVHGPLERSALDSVHVVRVCQRGKHCLSAMLSLGLGLEPCGLVNNVHTHTPV